MTLNELDRLVGELEVIYEDNHLISVVKEENILSQADNTKDIDMLTIVKKYIKDKYNKEGNVFLGLVHRLDRPVGGVMVFARTSKGASRLSNEIRKGDMQKYYYAVVNGKVSSEGTFKDYLLKDKRKNMVSVVSKNTKGAKYCELDYRLVDYKNGFSLVKIHLKTGRPHQIRVQFSSRGHALYGDQRYSKTSKVGEQIALFSCLIEVKHPTKDMIMTFGAKPKNEYPWNMFRIKE